LKLRTNIGSEAKWESIVGYSRAVRIGNHIVVSGTTSTGEDGGIVGTGDPYQQTIQILEKIEKAIGDAGGSMKDVVRTRMYVTNIEHWEEVGRAHGEFFREIKPAATIVEVNNLIEPEILVEIEALAIIENL
jgi:enamine deaminase RidA (YjgF/YER057c/UK114 family)